MANARGARPGPGPQVAGFFERRALAPLVANYLQCGRATQRHGAPGTSDKRPQDAQELVDAIAPATAQFQSGWLNVCSEPRWPSGVFFELCQRAASPLHPEILELAFPTPSVNPTVPDRFFRAEVLADPAGSSASISADPPLRGIACLRQSRQCSRYPRLVSHDSKRPLVLAWLSVAHHRPDAMVTDGIVVGDDGRPRCWWSTGDPLYLDYHDNEWGMPLADDRRLFEKLCLEGFQSGLSWLIILRKRPNFRTAFADFDAATIADYEESDVERLMSDTGIVRNRAKIKATINNARRLPELVDEFGSFAAYVWQYEPAPDRRPAVMDYATLTGLGVSAESTAMSKDLRKRGWAFVGPTTAYSTMESVGLVNDHLDGCHARPSVEAARASFQRPLPSRSSAASR